MLHIETTEELQTKLTARPQLEVLMKYLYKILLLVRTQTLGPAKN